MCAVTKASTMPKSMRKQCRDHKIAVKSCLEIVKRQKLSPYLLMQGNKSQRKIAQITALSAQFQKELDLQVQIVNYDRNNIESKYI